MRTMPDTAVDTTASRAGAPREALAQAPADLARLHARHQAWRVLCAQETKSQHTRALRGHSVVLLQGFSDLSAPRCEMLLRGVLVLLLLAGTGQRSQPRSVTRLATTHAHETREPDSSPHASSRVAPPACSVQGREYAEHERVQVVVNTVGPYNNPAETYK